MNKKSLDRIMGTEPDNLADRRVAERRNHQFSDSIGGDSSNYREPKFGSAPLQMSEKPASTRGQLRPSDYRHIRAWGRMLGSYEYYIISEQEHALATGAPLNAVYLGNKKWVTITECAPDTQEHIKQLLK